MAYTLSNMIRDAITTMGRRAYNSFTATGGSTTTAVNTNFNAVGDPVYSDGDESLVLGTLLVLETTDGAAPQGEFQRISSYVESTTTITVDTAFSAAIGAGDRCIIIHSQYSIETLKELANQALTDLGQFYTIDTSLTTSSSRTYTLPIAAKGMRPHSIHVETTTGNRKPVSDWDYITAAPGSTATIYFNHDLESGKTLYITYAYEHGRLTDFDDVVDESIPEAVAKWGLAVAIHGWGNPSDAEDINFANKAENSYNMALRRFNRWTPKKVPKWAVHG